MTVLIVSVLGAGLYAYSLTAFSSSASSFLLQSTGREDRARERILITTVWWNVTSDYLNVTILNFGKIEIVIDALYIQGQQVSPAAYLGGKGETLARGLLVSVKFTTPISIVDGQTYEIAAVTERGSRDVVDWEA